MTDTLASEGLIIKSKLFINRALDSSREFEEQAFWASCSLELLGKAALAQISPLLIANPSDDGKSLLAASGVTKGKPSSVQAKAVWSRCHRVFAPFNQDEAKLISEGRNEYIHSAGIGFAKLKPEIWWQRFWAQAIILLDNMNVDLEDFVDSSALFQIRSFIEARDADMSHRYEARLNRAVSNLDRYEDEKFSQLEMRQWAMWTPYSATYMEGAECPACHSEGFLYGEEVVGSDIDSARYYGEYYSDTRVILYIAPDAFDCPRCHLELYEYELLVKAGLEEAFEVEGSLEDIPYEEEYNNE